MRNPKFTARRTGVFRSGLESTVSKQLESRGIAYEYEQWQVPYVVPASKHIYTPDFLLPNGIFIETKGLWEADDRKKHLLIREQYPDLDIRLVFSNSNTKIYKGSPTSYAEWCEKHNIKFADKTIPIAWLREGKQEVDFSKLKKAKTKKEK
ncbi:endonuclease [Pasteurella phage vB_PmuP_PS07]|uniref:Endonuclease I n=1 Tax=Pasteurella phage vB_PmuP_Pa7 TaxID=2767198 RepID=A0A7G8ZYP9_9CAUD|nr:endonuclease I [Pasteurella phage vB_PmuP_Pa7]UIS73852.1 endonuclease [Pasteurella phage vB_PmuP_PS07]UIS74030.1 endonuclease I [Pasteurella phage vB_PmuP_PS30]